MKRKKPEEFLLDAIFAPSDKETEKVFKAYSRAYPDNKMKQKYVPTQITTKYATWGFSHHDTESGVCSGESIHLPSGLSGKILRSLKETVLAELTYEGRVWYCWVERTDATLT